MHRKLIWSALLIAALALSACSGLIPRSGDVAVPDMRATQDAFIQQAVQGTATTMALQAEIARLQTLVAQGTPAAQVDQSTAVPPTAAPTETPLSTETPAPTETTVFTTTAAPPTATATQVPPTPTLAGLTITPVLPTFTPSATALPCNAAQFVQDVTIPDGTTLSPNAVFTKTWRLKNVGACTWTPSYDMVFAGGERMGAPEVLDLPGNVAPGAVIDISINMTAPAAEGTYRSSWKLRDGAGAVYGVGRSNATFFAEIRVISPVATYPLDMAASYCQAEWTSGAGGLPCPGADADSRGFVVRVDKPLLESGYQDDEPALLTSPQMVTDGVIRGKFPTLRVENGSRFRAIIGCANKANGCDVNFQLDYQIGSGSIQTLKTWHEVYDEKFQQVEVDLSSLAGKDVRFILTVFANGTYNQDRALWLAPRIIK
jgi:hypothetical protein